MMVWAGRLPVKNFSARKVLLALRKEIWTTAKKPSLLSQFLGPSRWGDGGKFEGEWLEGGELKTGIDEEDYLKGPWRLVSSGQS